MIKLAAFDWNGTLLADTYAVYESNNEVFKLFNKKQVSFSAFQKYFDVPVKKYYTRVGISEQEIDQNSKKIARTFHDYYEQRVKSVRGRAGAKYLLKWLLKNNIGSIIVSNHTVSPILSQLERLKINKYFSSIVANANLEDALKGRSKKERLKKYIDSKKIKPEEVFIVGDTVEEIEIGKELGCITIAITHGNCSVKRLKEKKPDHLIYSLKEISKIIEKINSK